jgi:hypothetical protein
MNFMNIKKKIEKNNFLLLKSDAKVAATIIFAATINSAPTVTSLTSLERKIPVPHELVYVRI